MQAGVLMMGNDRRTDRRARNTLMGFCFFLLDGWTREDGWFGGCGGSFGSPITGFLQNHSDGRLQVERGGRLGYRVNAGLRFGVAIVVAKTIILRVFLLGLKMDPGIEELSFTVWVMVTISVYLELIK